MSFFKPLDYIFILSFTLLFVYDYFPDISLLKFIPKWVLLSLILGLVLFGLFFKKYRDINNTDILKWQVFFLFYILFLMGMLTFLGGHSFSGLSFDNKSVWIVLLISVFEIFSQWRRVKKSQI